MPTKKQTDDEKTPSINRIIAQINKDFGENVIGRISDMENIQIERIPSGIPKLDEALGGGFPLRRIVELYGVPSGGKSLISMLTIVQAQKKGLDAVYVDIEDSFDPVFAEKLGVDTKKLILVQSSIGEDALDFVIRLLKARPGVVVVDSVAAIITRSEMEENIDKAFMAPKARLMSKALAKINASNENTLVIFINQLRSTMAMYGPPTTTTGGRSLPHYASIRVEVKKAEQIHKDDKKTAEVIGQIVAFNVVKNKTAPPYKTGSFRFLYDDARVE